MTRIRDTLKEAGLRPSKGMGQNFLADEAVATRIVAAAALSADAPVVEIGPGLGALTRPLLATGHPVTAIEKDRAAVAWLGEQPWAERLTVVEADALTMDWTTLAARLGGPLQVVANLPYSVGTPILLSLLDQSAAVATMTLMFQKEVADRLRAVPGGKEYGSLSVHCQLLCRVEELFTVASAAFVPRPKVASAVVRLVVRPQPLANVGEADRFQRLLRAAFGQRRKTLGNALKNSGIPGEQLCREVGIDPARRGETLTVEEFAALSRAWETSDALASPVGIEGIQ